MRLPNCNWRGNSFNFIRSLRHYCGITIHPTITIQVVTNLGLSLALGVDEHFNGSAAQQHDTSILIIITVRIAQVHNGGRSACAACLGLKTQR